jgi:hypothetical protein
MAREKPFRMAFHVQLKSSSRDLSKGMELLSAEFEHHYSSG